MRIALPPIVLSIAMGLLLAACGTPGSTTVSPGTATPTMTAGASSSVATQPASANATPIAQIDPLQAIRMVDVNSGWAFTTKGAVLKTSDGGRHWQDVTPKTPSPDKSSQSEFLTAQAAWLAWENEPGQPITIVHTSNGGASWQTAVINNITGELAQDTLRFINPQQGWLATTRAEGMLHYTNNFYRTMDGGQTWSNVSGPTRSTSIWGISFANSQLGWAGLYWPGPTAQVEKTVNGGKSWQQVQLPPPAGMTEQQIGETETTAPVLIGANGLLPAHITMNTKEMQKRLVLYTTHNSGTTWVAGPLAGFDSNDAYALDTLHVWAEESNSNALHFSSDGGKTWTQLTQTPQHFGALSFVDLHNGWAIDDGGHLYRTMDGGMSWQTLS